MSHHHHQSDRNSPLPSYNNSNANSATPIGVPLYFDAQRKKRYIVPIRPAPLKDEQQQQQQSKNEDNKNTTHTTESILHRTTTTILVCGLPAIMSIPEILHLLFYDDIVLENPEINKQADEETKLKPSASPDGKQQTPTTQSSSAGKLSSSSMQQQQQQQASFTIDHQPNLFFRFLNSIRVCFGSEKGTLAMLVTFFNDEDDSFSDEKFTYSNAAAEFFTRWHGQSAFSLSKEILTVDFVDMKELKRREQHQQQEQEQHQQQEEAETHNNNNFSSSNNDQENVFAQEQQQNFISKVAPYWPFLLPADQKQIEHQQDEPCAICLEHVSFHLPVSSLSTNNQNNNSNSNNEDQNQQNQNNQQDTSSISVADPSLTTTEDFYTRLSDFTSCLQLPCQHLLHTSCFASVVGEAPCPLCRFNCCEEAFAATCSVCQQQQQQNNNNNNNTNTNNSNKLINPFSSSNNSQQQQQQQQQNINNNNNNNNQLDSHHLWVCLVCGDCFCSKQPNHREEHFLKDSSHHLFIQSGGLRIWDCHFDDYVHRVISNISVSSNQQQQQLVVNNNNNNNNNNEQNNGDHHSSTAAENNNEENINNNNNGIDDAWRDHLDWADDEAEIEANLLQSKMAVMENYYNDLLLEQLQAQEEHFVEKVKKEGLIAKCEKFFSKERIARNQIASKWRQELKSNIQGQFFVQMKMRTRQLKGQDAKLKDEIEIQQVVFTTANATREKYKKFLSAGGSASPAAAASTTTSSSTTTTTSNNNNNKKQQQPQQQQPKKPTTLQEVSACIDKHPDVVALEKELEGLINELTSM